MKYKITYESHTFYLYKKWRLLWFIPIWTPLGCANTIEELENEIKIYEDTPQFRP